MESDSVDEFLLKHVIEHIQDSLSLMEELYRVAKHDATLKIIVPHGATDDAFEDPTHRRVYFPWSFFYFQQPAYWRADYGYRGDWHPEKVELVVFRDRFRDWPEDKIFEEINTKRNQVHEIRATMKAVKPARAQVRELSRLARPEITFIDGLG